MCVLFQVLGSPVWADGEADWMEVEDPASGKTYWYNTKTQKTSFEKPGATPAAAAPASSGSASESQSERPKISRMGGLLDSYKDINKGFSLYKPTGWNQFEAAPGEYDIKWEVRLFQFYAMPVLLLKFVAIRTLSRNPSWSWSGPCL
jgi:hypothetical protein